MFQKILIANRGEIACRIIKTARRMGIATVAVYSDADRDALHVEMADEAVHIGPAPATQSYLQVDRIVQAARDGGAQAVHPGYGFLSERESFAAALAEAGIAFIGPNARAIAAMGDKIASKKLARAAGVSTVPGFMGEIRDEAHAREIAREIGFPVMVKASAGGGGKGLRVVKNEDELGQAIISSRNEAQASFGDGRLLVEKFVTEPRHIEIQLMADKHGNVIYLNERECSIQRRHQKVVEEAPSPFLDEKTRAAMGGQAVALAKAVGYDSAGTVEFIVDGARNFYFLEMNTRLQVEHPVTEMITGLDLVELMIRSAAGEKLPLAQKDVKRDGWAIEARVYAEDPYRGFLPSTGRLTRYRPPHEGTHKGVTIRNDTGVFEGGEISVYYDPMIAKLSTHAETREKAIDAMASALDRFEISGIAHNVPFLAAIMHNPRFREGRLTTGFIAEEFPEGFKGAPLSEADSRLFVAAAVAAKLRRTQRAGQISGALNGGHQAANSFVASIGGREVAICDAHLAVGSLRLAIDGRIFEAIVDWFPGRPQLILKHQGQETVFQIARHAGGYHLSQGGRELLVSVRSPYAAKLATLMLAKAPPDTSRLLLCPMPGLITALSVSEGQSVKAGDPLAVVEAMKMENVLLAERDGVIAKVLAKKGDNLGRDDVILEFQ
ncbi:MAG: acetyl/propionyl/methylcrotonyl-CoA carboxylase subunit alpha [Alphaproteobacteria bacterium]|nr:acetyl/propionyl/methylcrotonyl-CoA carboxylase subunit alpha [Alphaproteobacteria bacterium]